MNALENGKNQRKSLFEYLDFRLFLAHFLAERKSTKSTYSLRLLASKMECSPGFLTRVIGGQRNLSDAHALRLGEILKFDKKEKEFFTHLVRYTQATSHIERANHLDLLQRYRVPVLKKLTLLQQAFYSRWFFPVIRELIHVIPCRGDKEKIVKLITAQLQPAVPKSDVSEALDILESLDLIKRNHHDCYQLTDTLVSAGEDIPQVLIHRVLLEYMDLARLAVDIQPRSSRSLSAVTVSVSKAGYEKMQECMGEFRRELLEIAKQDAGPVDRVYHANLQLFPVSKVYEGNNPL